MSSRPIGREQINYRIQCATPEDKPEVIRLLEISGLPAITPEESHVQVVVARVGERLIGCAGWEQYGDYALLR